MPKSPMNLSRIRTKIDNYELELELPCAFFAKITLNNTVATLQRKMIQVLKHAMMYCHSPAMLGVLPSNAENFDQKKMDLLFNIPIYGFVVSNYALREGLCNFNTAYRNFESIQGLSVILNNFHTPKYQLVSDHWVVEAGQIITERAESNFKIGHLSFVSDNVNFVLDNRSLRIDDSSSKALSEKTATKLNSVDNLVACLTLELHQVLAESKKNQQDIKNINTNHQLAIENITKKNQQELTTLKEQHHIELENLKMKNVKSKSKLQDLKMKNQELDRVMIEKDRELDKIVKKRDQDQERIIEERLEIRMKQRDVEQKKTMTENIEMLTKQRDMELERMMKQRDAESETLMKVKEKELERIITMYAEIINSKDEKLLRSKRKKTDQSLGSFVSDTNNHSPKQK